MKKLIKKVLVWPLQKFMDFYLNLEPISDKAKKSFDIRGKIVHATWTKRQIPTWFY